MQESGAGGSLPAAARRPGWPDNASGAAIDVLIREYKRGDRDDALRVLTAAFLNAPDAVTMVGSGPAAEHRLRRLNALAFEPATKLHAVIAERDERIVGVLTWADLPDCSAMTLGQVAAVVRVVGVRLPGTIRMFLKGSRAHPATAHRHIQQVGVDPAAQGHGIGTALVRHLCRMCDDAGLPTYLETYVWSSGEQMSLRRFYERFGFSVTREVAMNAAWSGIAMVRPIHSAPATLALTKTAVRLADNSGTSDCAAATTPYIINSISRGVVPREVQPCHGSQRRSSQPRLGRSCSSSAW